MTTSTIDLAERLVRRRARVATAMGILLITTQSAFVVHEGPMRTVDLVQSVAWAVWIVVIAVFVLFGGGLLRGSAVRSLMNDESSEQNRRSALVGGFWATMAAAMICYAITFYESLGGREAVHAIVTIGVGAALLRFGALERRALAG